MDSRRNKMKRFLDRDLVLLRGESMASLRGEAS